MPRWVPNLFTIVRLLLVPAVIRAILGERQTEALVLFAAAAVTDVLDGAAARAFHLTSQLGAYLDPIADKALLSGVFLALALSGKIPWWLVIVIFGRDLYLLLAAILLLWLTPRRKFPPSWWGKASTFVQVVTAIAWMSRNLHHFAVLDLISGALLWPCAAFTIWSGVHYTWRGIQVARAH
jgi:cardiolipin synthase